MKRRFFRPARPAAVWWNLAKTLVQTALFWFVFLAVLPWGVSRTESAIGWQPFPCPFQQSAPWIVFALASGLGIWSGATMAIQGRGTPLPTDTARELVVRGPYRYVRNPMAVAGLVQGAAIGLWLGSIGMLFCVLIAGMFWNWVVRPIEEADLQQRFGQDFESYRTAVPCWIPRRIGYDGI